MSEAISLLRKWEKTFWALRGVTVAVTLMLIVPPLIGWTQLSFLRAFYALTIAWHDALRWLAGAISKLPFVPDVGADVMFGLALALSAGLPAGWAMGAALFPLMLWLIHRTRSARAETALPRRREDVITSNLPNQVLVALLVSLLFFAAARGVYPYLSDSSSVARYFSQDLQRGEGNLFWFLDIVVHPDPYADFVRYLIPSLALYWLYALVRIPGYFRGFVYVVGFIAAMQVLYVLNTPGWKNWVDERAALVVGSSPQEN